MNKDSLWSVWEDPTQTDTAKMKAIADLAWARMYQDPDSANALANKLLHYSDSINNDRVKAIAYETIAGSWNIRSKYEKSIHFNKKSAEIRKELKNYKGLISNYSNLGLAYKNMGKYTKALEYYEKSLDIAQKKGFEEDKSSIYMNMASVHRFRGHLPKSLSLYQKALSRLQQGNTLTKAYITGNMASLYKQMESYDKALNKYKKSLRFFQKEDDKRHIATSHFGIGDVLFDKKDTARAYEHFQKALKVFKSFKDRRKLAMTYQKLGKIHFYWKEYQKAEEFFQKGLKIAKEGKLNRSLTILWESLGRNYLVQGQHQKAEGLCQKAFSRAVELDVPKWKKSCSGCLFEALKLQGKYKQALHYNEITLRLTDSLKNEEKTKKLTRMEMSFQFEKERMKDSIEQAKKKKIQQARIAKKNAKLEKEQTIRYGLIGGSLILLAFLALIFERFRTAKKRKEVIEQQKNEVDQAYQQLHEKNKEVTDSIHYASRIQTAILTSEKVLNEALGEHFIYFNPKDVVSGDFYWAYKDERYSIWIAADCTGHGVPGAFMSMIGNRLLNEVIVEQGERDPGKILDKIREGVIDALGQSGAEERKDGMDAALCVLDQENRELRFAGANNPLYIVEEGKWEMGKATREKGAEPPMTNYRNLSQASEPDESPFFEIKPDKQPIGQPDGDLKPFSTQAIQLQAGDIAYTFSDGYADQFGGPKGKKFRYKPFKRLLIKLQSKPMQERKDLLKKEFEDWRGNQEQVDDVVIIGVKVG